MLNCKLQDTNYRAKVVKIDRLEPHPNADRLLIAVVDYQRIIVGLDTKIGDLCIYFPLESQINDEFVSFINGYSDANLNQDKTKKGYLSSKARIRATKLRNVVSEGYLHPVSSFNEFLADKKIKFQLTEKEVGVEFDSIGELLICNKYVIKQKGSPNSQKQKDAKKLSKLIDGQLRLHGDTKPLKKNLNEINPEDFISVSEKIHGCCSTFAKVLCRKPLKIHEKILKKLGVNIVDSHYDYLVCSRRVVKNAFDEKDHNHFYDFDIWTHVFENIKDKIQDGISLYGEICGELPTGAYIQKDYDYGCKPNSYKYFVFRITYTDNNGNVFEFTQPQVERYCRKYELEMPPLYFYGKAKDMYPELDVENHWHENFLANLIRDYNEMDCPMCRNKVPREGIVVTKEGEVWTGLKLKSMRFLEKETADLDSGTTNLEDEG